ncbi:AIPR family protein [Pseudomonas extremaustralis]|uniref:AIPR family protein n=2 Tax=Pseudomonas extremaustralis TaxID=359110 RepID=A0A5C5Q4L1_9PSED|nr:AIPR family protein [Pseudomonas extremaustralis]
MQMSPDDLKYESLQKILAVYEEKGRGESIAFLNWFLENIFRLDPVDADDAICDRPNDRGIDGVYVDHTKQEIIILQGKLKQRESTIGDAGLRELAGTISQFDTPQSVQALLDGGANQELKAALTRNNVKSLIENGYEVIGAFICNQALDANGMEFLDQDSSIRVYDRNLIASELIDIDREGGVKGTFSFDTSYVSPMVISTGTKAITYILPVQAVELVMLSGIDDGTLFSQNVRHSLGNTKVNKELRVSVLDKSEHENFTLYHNGVTILCKDAKFNGEAIEITDYVVVNGAQSISTFRKSREHLSKDLRVLAKIIKLEDSVLSKKITINSNNQNAIKPRDLKSNNEIQVRLLEEFKRVEGGEYAFEIKRGQDIKPGKKVITNEEAGRLLLAFDLLEPESCHQVYKLFDDKYNDIFARPAVTAHRILFLHAIMGRILTAAEGINYKPLAKYGLTRFFLLSVISDLMKSNSNSAQFLKEPRALFEAGTIQKFLQSIEEVLQSIVIDLNFEVESLGDQFDYKGDLKSPAKLRELRGKLRRSYEKDVARKKS